MPSDDHSRPSSAGDNYIIPRTPPRLDPNGFTGTPAEIHYLIGMLVHTGEERRPATGWREKLAGFLYDTTYTVPTFRYLPETVDSFKAGHIAPVTVTDEQILRSVMKTYVEKQNDPEFRKSAKGLQLDGSDCQKDLYTIHGTQKIKLTHNRNNKYDLSSVAVLQGTSSNPWEKGKEKDRTRRKCTASYVNQKKCFAEPAGKMFCDSVREMLGTPSEAARTTVKPTGLAAALGTVALALRQF